MHCPDSQITVTPSFDFKDRSRRLTSIGRAERRRIRTGGPRAKGRPASSVDEWALIRDAVLARSCWTCQACGIRTGREVHHVRKRSQGGSDFDLDWLVTLCRACHAQTDAPYAKRRLVVTPPGSGHFECVVVHARSKRDVLELEALADGML